MRGLVLPAFQGITLREIGVARCDALLKQLGNSSYSPAKRTRTVLRQSFALAVRHEVLPRNPIDNVSRLHKPKRTPTALTAAEVNAVRAVIKAWESTTGTSGRTPTDSSARSSRSCSAPPPGSARSWPAAAATWT